MIKTSHSLPLDGLEVKRLSGVAELEAASFLLPEDWHRDRPRVGGWAFDPSGTLDADDAIDLATSHDQHERLLQISITDTASFLPQYWAISNVAMHNGWTIYGEQGAERPMIPRAISENALSLSRGEERPVFSMYVLLDSHGFVKKDIFSYDCATVNSLDYDAFRHLANLKDGNPATKTLRDLAFLSFQLRAQRCGRRTPQLSDIGEDAFYDSDIARRIVQECMTLFNVRFGKFLAENNIPAIYRTHTLSDSMMADLHAKFKGDNHQALAAAANLARASYEPTPEAHFALRIQPFAHGTSPLRRFDDYANLANALAWFNEDPFPYPQEKIDLICSRLNRLEAQYRARNLTTPETIASPDILKHLERKAKLGRHAVNHAKARDKNQGVHRTPWRQAGVRYA